MKTHRLLIVFIIIIFSLGSACKKVGKIKKIPKPNPSTIIPSPGKHTNKVKRPFRFLADKDRHKITKERFLSNSSDQNSPKVLISYYEGKFLLDSPGISESKKLDTPDLENILTNGLVRTNDNQKVKDTEYIFDYQVVNSPEFKKIKLDDAVKISFISANGEKYPTKNFVRSDGSTFRLAERSPNIFFSIIDGNFESLNKELFSIEFQKDEVELLSLVNNKATTDQISATISHRSTVFDFSRNNFEELLESKKGKTLFVLSHIEDNSFVALTPTNKELFRMDIKEAMQLGEKYHVNLFPYGCNSSLAAEGLTKAGTGNYMQSIEAVQRFADVIDKKNFGELLTDLAADDLAIIVEQVPYTDFGYKQIRRVRIYKKGTVIASGPVLITLYLVSKAKTSEWGAKSSFRPTRMNIGLLIFGILSVVMIFGILGGLIGYPYAKKQIA